MNTNHGFPIGVSVPLNFTPPEKPTLTFAEQKAAADKARHDADAEKARKSDRRRDLIRTAIDGYGGPAKAGATLRAGLIAQGVWLTPDRVISIDRLRTVHAAAMVPGEYLADSTGEIATMLATRAAEALSALVAAITEADAHSCRFRLHLTDYFQVNDGLDEATKAAFRMCGPDGQGIIDAIDAASRIV